MKSINILFLAMAYALIGVNYFGDHFFPQSDAEMLAGGFCMIMICLGIFALDINKKEPPAEIVEGEQLKTTGKGNATGK